MQGHSRAYDDQRTEQQQGPKQDKAPLPAYQLREEATVRSIDNALHYRRIAAALAAAAVLWTATAIAGSRVDPRRLPLKTIHNFLLRVWNWQVA